MSARSPAHSTITTQSGTMVACGLSFFSSVSTVLAPLSAMHRWAPQMPGKLARAGSACPASQARWRSFQSGATS